MGDADLTIPGGMSSFVSISTANLQATEMVEGVGMLQKRLWLADPNAQMLHMEVPAFALTVEHNSLMDAQFDVIRK